VRLICCRGGATRSLVCLLDNLLHEIRLHVSSVCDRHDRNITGD
jgi:hypothetical protein